MVIDLSMGRREDIIFNTARQAVDRLTKKFESERDWQVEQNVWSDLSPDQRRSPKIMAIGNPNDEIYMIYCPKYSAELKLSNANNDIYFEMIGGTAIDRITGKKFSKGDRCVFELGKSIDLVTLHEDAYIKIEKLK